jgi:hypothetical protein
MGGGRSGASAQGRPPQGGRGRPVAIGDGDDGEMDRRTSADGRTRLSEPSPATTPQKASKEMVNMTISRTDPFSLASPPDTLGTISNIIGTVFDWSFGDDSEESY